MRVSFGVPFPKGFVTHANSVRVLDAGGKELPVFIKVLTPWRHLDLGVDDASLRSVLVQLEAVFPDRDGDGRPDAIELGVEWGKNTREVAALTEKPVREDWVLVDDASYKASDGVFEPQAFALFTPDWYGQCLIKTRILPAGSHPGLSSFDAGMGLFARTAINQVDPRVTARNLIPYRTDYEPWLFDRATALYQAAFRTGDVGILREAHRATQFYANHINSEGWFDMKEEGDLKYCYGESLCADFWLTGDTRLPGVLQRMMPMFDGFNAVYTLESNFWTERHCAFKLLGYVTSYELVGDKSASDKAKETFTALVNMQDKPVSGAAASGGLMHTSASHGEGSSELICSPWMSGLLVDAVERYYLHSGDARVPRFVTRLADFVKTPDVGMYSTPPEAASTNELGVVTQYYPFSEQGNIPRLVPYYLAGPGLTSGQHSLSPYDDIEHTLDVSKVLALAYFFSRASGTPNTSYLRSFSDLYQTYSEVTLPNWTRPYAPESGLSVFRLSPPRKFNWWFRSTSGLDWLLGTNTVLETTAEASSAKLELTLTADRKTAVPGDVITYTMRCRNVGTRDASAVQVRNRLFQLNAVGSDPDLELLRDSLSTSLEVGPDIYWPLDVVRAGAPEKTATFQVRVKSNPVVQTLDRPLAPFLSQVVAFFCASEDPQAACSMPTGVWDSGRYQRAKAGNLLEIQRPLTTHPPRPDLIPPGAPEQLRFSGGAPGEVRLSWIPTTEYDLAGYRVYRCDTEDGAFAPLTTNLLKSAAFTDRGLPSGKTYFYRVAEVDQAGLESNYNPVVFATSYDKPPTPRIKAQLLPAGSIGLTFTGGVGWSYRLEYSIDLQNWNAESELTIGLDGKLFIEEEYFPHNPQDYPAVYWRAVIP